MKIIILGILATLFMDLWAYMMKITFNIKGLDYKLVGRWAYYITQGTFFHQTIIQTKPAPNESLIGWSIHYLIGIFFAIVLIIIFGSDWLVAPQLIPALIVGLITLLAPFYIMQPAFGFGVAASLTPAPFQTRVKSIMAHTSYGVGLYLAGLTLSL
ncbi:DUF2938 domain-containing protein [Halobacteriovorax sp. DA5]|uniref:DUF2938 domain-containing protein n=1 Tax=Halobacteriovorax sp. DA5 TaxID=2067553 RepID=UPI000CD0A2F1|nr:DUF2938 domain-containing protein [Halobacteriovorax sp. DA5]POB13573.1 DUF2938 domain-containing protein [Halobacteriovorax sp. DA5]